MVPTPMAVIVSLLPGFTELGEYAPEAGDCNFLPVSDWYCGTKEKCIRGKMRKDCLPIRTVYRQSEDVYLRGRGYGKPFMLL